MACVALNIKLIQTIIDEKHVSYQSKLMQEQLNLKEQHYKPKSSKFRGEAERKMDWVSDSVTIDGSL